MLLKRVLHHQVGRKPVVALRLRHHVTSEIGPILELEVLLPRHYALSDLPILWVAVQIDIVEGQPNIICKLFLGLLDRRNLLERLMRRLLELHSHCLVIVIARLRIKPLLTWKILAIAQERLLLGR